MKPEEFQNSLIEKAKSDIKRIVLPEGSDDRILKAADELLKESLCEITILGKEDEIQKRGGELGLNLEKAQVIDPASSDKLDEYSAKYFELRKHKGISEDDAKEKMTDVSYYGTMMVFLGDADGMVSGAINSTGHTIRPSLEFVKTKPGCSIVSSIFFMCLPEGIKVYGDCAVNPNPTAEQLADIAVSSAETSESFGIEARIAMLSYSTGVSGKGDDVELVKEAVEIAKKKAPNLKIEGPIQYDAAVDEKVASIKMPDSEVAGKASVFVFPDLNSGNITYKAVQRETGIIAIGPVLQGLNKPVNDLSRGCSVPDIVNTVVITAIQAQA